MNTVDTFLCRLCEIAKHTPCVMCVRKDKQLCGGASRKPRKPCPYFLCRNFAACCGRRGEG